MAAFVLVHRNRWLPLHNPQVDHTHGEQETGYTPNNVLFADQPLPQGRNPTMGQLKTYVGLLYGYLYTDGNLGTRGAQPAHAGGENDRAQYEEYEQGVLRDLLGVYNATTLPPLAHAPPLSQQQRHDEHVNTLRSEYKEYKAEALDAFELSVLVDGSLRYLHPTPGSSGGDDLAQVRATREWDKRTLVDAVQTVAGGRPVGRGRVIEILVTSKVDSRLAQHYIQKAITGRNERLGLSFPGQALTGRSRQRALLSRCYCARALCMMMEADAAAAVRAKRESLKRIAARGGEDAAEAVRAIARCNYRTLGSPDQVSFFAMKFPDQLSSKGAGLGQGDGLVPIQTRFKAAESAFIKELGLPEGSSLIDPKRTLDGDLERLCMQLERRFEFAATRELTVPERDHFLSGLSVGVALTWAASSFVAVSTCALAGLMALVLASAFLGDSLVPVPAWWVLRRSTNTKEAPRQEQAHPNVELIDERVEDRFNEWMVRQRAENVFLDTIPQEQQMEERARIRQDVIDELNQGNVAEPDVNGDVCDAVSAEGLDRGLATLCWGSRLHAMGLVSRLAHCVPESLTDTRAMMAWVSQLLGISLGGLLAAGFAAGGGMLESSGSVADFVQRFLQAAV